MSITLRAFFYGGVVLAVHRRQIDARPQEKPGHRSSPVQRLCIFAYVSALKRPSPQNSEQKIDWHGFCCIQTYRQKNVEIRMESLQLVAAYGRAPELPIGHFTGFSAISSLERLELMESLMGQDDPLRLLQTFAGSAQFPHVVIEPILQGDQQLRFP